jgi:hypothetical protein
VIERASRPRTGDGRRLCAQAWRPSPYGGSRWNQFAPGVLIRLHEPLGSALLFAGPWFRFVSARYVRCKSSVSPDPRLYRGRAASAVLSIAALGPGADGQRGPRAALMTAAQPRHMESQKG